MAEGEARAPSVGSQEGRAPSFTEGDINTNRIPTAPHLPPLERSNNNIEGTMTTSALVRERLSSQFRNFCSNRFYLCVAVLFEEDCFSETLESDIMKLCRCAG